MTTLILSAKNAAYCRPVYSLSHQNIKVCHSHTCRVHETFQNQEGMQRLALHDC